jgi:hypothetical protein
MQRRSFSLSTLHAEGSGSAEGEAVSLLTDEELCELERRYADSKPTHPCRYCGAVDWLIGSVGRGSTSWRCARIDMSDRETRSLHYSESLVEMFHGDPRVLQVVTEIRHHAATQRSNKKRVHEVVLQIASDVLERPDAKVLRRFDVADEIAERVAEQLATPAVESHRAQVARLADSLPVDPGAETHFAHFLNKAYATAPKRRLISAALSVEELRGLQCICLHLDNGGHDWRDGTAMADVEAACAWLDRLLGAKS